MQGKIGRDLSRLFPWSPIQDQVFLILKEGQKSEDPPTSVYEENDNGRSARGVKKS